ncbi:MAG: hypothetical protein E7592_00225 [Ruminococcaceae bacterium]|nr:hypothetical protein [Oscillospiraceae bacterium]
MFKYNSMISSIKDDDKVRILTDVMSLSDGERVRLGIPGFAVLNMRRMLKDGKYPSPQALAHSWDNKLIYELSGEVALSAASSASSVILTPGAKVKLSPYRNEMSEDIYLSRSLATEFARGVKYAGSAAAVSGYYLSDTDVEWMDASPSRAVLHEFLIEPFKRTLIDGQAPAVITDRRILANEYSNENAYLSDEKMGNVPSGTCVVAKRVSAEDTVPFLVNGGICLKGSQSALENALKTYYKLQKKQESGEVTMGEVEAEIKAGRAISPELIDAALERLFTFLLKSDAEKGKRLLPDQKEQLALRATRSSVVLLKNEGAMLPLNIKNVSSVALISGIADESGLLDRCEAQLLANGVGKVEKARGYDFTKDVATSDDDCLEALSAVGTCDLTILFVGHGEKRGNDISLSHKVSLPANQLELADRLIPHAKKVIVVLETGYGVDMAFAEPFCAVMLAPFGVRNDASVIIDTLLGKSEPLGRLPYTLYSDIDGYSEKHLSYRDKYGVKSGRFVGYRYYTTAGLQEKYPFGHGLSYTKFAYSKLEVSGNTVSFTVTNTGKRAGREVAQIYVGSKDSRLIRPARELCGYAIVDLNVKESKRVSVEIELPAVFDENSNSMIVEKGTYTVYVGSSSTDIKLSTKIHGGSETVSAGSEDKLYEYLQTESNIIGDKYTLEAGYKLMKRSIKNIVCGIGASVLAIALGVYNALTSSATFLGVLTAILAVTGIIFFIVDAVEKNKAYAKEREMIAKENQKHFEDAEKLEEFSAENMFRTEFDAVSENQNDTQQVTVKEHKSYDESLKYVDKKLDFARATKEFKVFALERGLMLDDEVVKGIFASVSASRMLVFKDMSSEDFKSLISALSEYFGTKTYIDKVDPSYVNEESALFAVDEEGHRVKKNMTYAIESALNVKEKLHIAALDGVKSEDMMVYFAPYVKHAKNPFGYTSVVAHNERNKETAYYIPKNIWFAINLAIGESYDMIPDFLSEIATVNRISISKSTPSNKHSDFGNFYYYQLDYISERAVNRYVIGEELWKKIDSLEKRVKSIAPEFAINNKMCLAFEKSAAALMAAGLEIKQSVDMALAVKIMPSILFVTSGKKTESGDSIVEIFDSVFGDDDMMKCAEVIKDAETYKKDSYSQPETVQNSDIEYEVKTTEDDKADVAEAVDLAEDTADVNEDQSPSDSEDSNKDQD